jgi:hypothetical protein
MHVDRQDQPTKHEGQQWLKQLNPHRRMDVYAMAIAKSSYMSNDSNSLIGSGDFVRVSEMQAMHRPSRRLYWILTWSRRSYDHDPINKSFDIIDITHDSARHNMYHSNEPVVVKQPDQLN